MCVLLPSFFLYRVCFGSWNSHNIVVARSFMVQHTRDGPLFVFRGIFVWNPIVFLSWLALFPLFLLLSIFQSFFCCVSSITIHSFNQPISAKKVVISKSKSIVQILQSIYISNPNQSQSSNTSSSKYDKDAKLCKSLSMTLPRVLPLVVPPPPP